MEEPTDKPAGKHAKRTRTGCLTCRKRHYKCDETQPVCNRCERSKVACVWSQRRNTNDFDFYYHDKKHRSQGSSLVDYSTFGQGRSQTNVIGSSSKGNPAEEDEHSMVFPIYLTTKETDALTFYISQFHNYSYQICAWTSLIQLPKRSYMPSILQTRRKHSRRLTNWGSFFLPHLSNGTATDPLALALAAFTALRMKDRVTAVSFYAKVLSLLRSILKRKNAASMSNQEFLRIWAATLLLAEYEAQLGNQKFESQHVEGATTLSFIAAPRFALYPATQPGTEISPVGSVATVHTNSSTGSNKPAEVGQLITVDGQSATTPLSESAPRNERELPGYLMALTQRLRHSNTICESLDTEWPTFEQPPIERHSLGGLLEKSAECYAHVMPLVESFYFHLSTNPPKTPIEQLEMMALYQPRVIAARQCIEEYRAMLELVVEEEAQIYQSCALPGFPFSPVIRFVNPQMAQPTVIPHVFTMFLAPFISAEEHHEAMRFISGVFEGFEHVEGLKMDAAFPDLYVAAFWRRGIERDYFHREVYRRGGDFLYVMNRIWSTIDGIEQFTGREPTETEILGIALKEYRDASARGLLLQNTRH